VADCKRGISTARQIHVVGLVKQGSKSCHGHEYQHAANKEVAGICRRICAILELKKEEEITRVCASNNTLGIIKVRARGQPREQKYVAALESTRKLAVTVTMQPVSQSTSGPHRVVPRHRFQLEIILFHDTMLTLCYAKTRFALKNHPISRHRVDTVCGAIRFAI